MPALQDMNIFLRPRTRAWQYSLFRDGKPKIKIESNKQFKRHFRKNLKIYAIVINPSHRMEGPTATKTNQLPSELQQYEDVFAAENATALPPHRPGVDMAIPLQEGQQPPYGPLYPLSPAELEVLRGYLEENLKRGYIRHSKSPAGAPILFVPKKDGSLRLCVDYRGLNAITVKNRYPLPLISEIMDRVNGATVFSKIDLKEAYHKIRIEEGEEWKTAFRTRYGHFEYLVMPFGLTNAPAVFQAYINQAMRGLVDCCCIVYLDDILIFSRTKEEHAKHLQQVCQRLREFELYANPKKCEFYQDQMEFLGFIINKDGIQMDPQRIQTIQEWKDHPPQSYRDVQIFLGFCNFYRRFIRRYAHYSRPLSQLLKGSKNGKKFGDLKKEWGPQQEQAFHTLLDAFTKAPILRHYDPSKPSKIETDASDVALGAIFSQLFDDEWHPVAFHSRQFKGAERNYSTPDKEMYSIVEAFKHWRHYLEGSTHPIEVWTDHKNLQGFMKQPKLNGRQARWCFELTPYDFTIRYRTGLTNPADGPSRRPDYQSVLDRSEEQEARNLLAPLAARIAEMQIPKSRLVMGTTPKTLRVTEYLSTLEARVERRIHSIQVLGRQRSRTPEKVAGSLKTPEKVESSGYGRTPEKVADQGTVETEETDHLLRTVSIQAFTRGEAHRATREEEPSNERCSQGLLELLREAQDLDSDTQQKLRTIETKGQARQPYEKGAHGLLQYKKKIVVPNQRAVIGELMSLYHDDEHAGHWGVEKTLELLRRKLWWPTQKKDVEEYVKTCPVCQGKAIARHKPYGELQPLPRPTRPWKDIAVDWITGLPESITTKGKFDSILVIVDRYSRMALFLPCTRDMDAAEFAETIYAEVEMRFGTPSSIVSDRDTRITSQFWKEVCYYGKIKRRLSTSFHPQTDGQTEALNNALENYLRAYIGTDPHSWAKLLPTAEFAYNNSYNHSLKTTPFKCVYGYDPEVRIDVADDVPEGGIPSAKERVQKLQDLRKQLEDLWVQAQEHQIKYYNQRHQPMQFRRGQLVKLSTKNLRLKNKKLAPRWIGPFRITEVVGRQAYRLALPTQYSKLHDIFPIQLLEPYHPRPDEEPLPMPDLEEDPEEYEVEEVRGKQKMQGKIHYLVKWVGWPSEYNQWIPEEDMANARSRIRSYEKGLAKRKKLPAS
jgi:hypothetical protein